MKNKTKFLAVLGVFAIIISFSFSSLNTKKIIVIDAGHGGEDFGAQIDGVQEKKIVESIAKKISQLNSKGDAEIILLREDDSFIELNERVSKVNKINPNLLISIHINASKNLNENGINAYVSKENDYYKKSTKIAKDLVEKISNEKLAKGEVKDSNLLLAKKSKCPALVLEVGYLSNEKDRNYISSENGQNEIANKIYEFIKK